MALAPNGDVFVAESRANQIRVLRDTNGDGAADARFVFAANLSQPFGMAFQNGYFYVANTNSIVRFKYKSGQTAAEGEPEKLVDLPGQGYNQHWTRNIIFSPDGKKMYISVGSKSNVDVEPPLRAAILEADADGSNLRVFAGGLRNPVGTAFNPQTKQLWTTVNERDGLGDDLVPDYLTSVKDGAFYGFPFAYLGPNEEPRRKGENPELVKKTVAPDVLFQAHSAALGLMFYNGRMFPAEYRGDAFVAFRGSWNRAKLTGYKIVRVKFKNGRPIGGYEDFLTGWLPDENGNEVWGRPVGLLALRDGSMLITDDGANKIWRVSYQK
jgi:glucose/arabinose dehydrogenase